MPDEFRYEQEGNLAVYQTRSYRSRAADSGVLFKKWAADHKSSLLQQAVQDLAKFVPLPQQRAAQQTD